MKKLFFGLMTIALVSAGASCTKCGHCLYADGSTSSSVCKSSTLSVLGVDEYAQAKDQCKASNGTWQ